MNLLDRAREPVRLAMKDARVEPKSLDEVILVGGSTRIPAVRQAVMELTGGKEPTMSVNPDEVVALGAAVQAGVLSGDVSGLVLLDVTPLSLGVETVGGVMTKLIQRNTTIPTTKTEVFSTAADSQASVDIVILQGEREFAKDNKVLGNFQLKDLPPAPRGVPQIEVSFDIGADGILSVSAKDKGTGKSQDIKITGASTLAEAEVQQMVRDAEEHAAEDAKRRQAVDTKNNLESVVFQAERQLASIDPEGKKITPEMRKPVEAAIKKAKEKLEAESPVSEMKFAQEELQKAMMEVGAKMYEGQSPTSTGSGKNATSASKPGNDSDVVEAEFNDIPASDK